MKNQIRQSHRATTSSKGPYLNRANFPGLISEVILNTTHNTNNNNFKTSYASALLAEDSQDKSNLFSANKLLTIFKEIVNGIKNCKSREEQFVSIPEIALKYAFK